MNEPATEPNSAQAASAEVKVEETSSKKPSLFRIPFTSKPDTANAVPQVAGQDTPADISRRAKILGPGVKQCFGILNRTTVKLLQRRLRKAGVQKDRASEIAEIAQLSPESMEVLKDSGGRLLARRVQNEEAADLLAVSGVLVEFAGSIADVLSEIRELQKQNEATKS